MGFKARGGSSPPFGSDVPHEFPDQRRPARSGRQGAGSLCALATAHRHLAPPTRPVCRLIVRLYWISARSPSYGTTRTVSDPAKLSPSFITPVSVSVASGGATMAFTASSLNLATRFPQESASVETTSTPLS